MTIKNQVMLITYADSMGKNLKELGTVLRQQFNGAIGGIHILPFFPSSADRGFAPLTYEVVDPVFGDWEDIVNLGQDFDLMVDFMINHISRSSFYYQDFQQKKEQSEYAEFFIRYKYFWPDGEPSAQDLKRIYTRKPRAPYVDIQFDDGTTEKLWCTFDEEQIDLNVNAPVTQKFIHDTLTFLAQQKAAIIRLDAFAYATKKRDTNCFFVEPEVWELLDNTRSLLAQYQVEVLPEIHEHYSIQQKIAAQGHWVYDFSLPMLILFTLYSGTKQRLSNWLRQCPRRQFTTLDTHDGIGVVDVRDLLNEAEIEFTKEHLFAKGANVKRIYNTMAYNNLDIYQINCTYYSALGNNDAAYLLARAIQFFTPGIPQVYYVGLLAGENDLELLEKTKVGRNINRHYYSMDEIAANTQRPVVQQLLALMRFRNSYPAFDGDFAVAENESEHLLELCWKKDSYEARLKADLQTYQYHICFFDPAQNCFCEQQ